MIDNKSIWKIMTVLGGLAVSLSFLPTPAKAETNLDSTVSPATPTNPSRWTLDRTLSPAPSNNPTRTNTVNGTTIPIWTIDGGLQITMPSEPLNPPLAEPFDPTLRGDRMDTPPSQRMEPVSPDMTPRTPPSERVEPTPSTEPGVTTIWIPSGLGRSSGNTGGPPMGPMPGTRIEVETSGGVSGTPITPDSSIERRTIEPTTPNTPEPMTVPSDRMSPDGMNNRPMTPMTPDGTTTPGTTVPDRTEDPNMQMRMEMDTAPSRQGRPCGHTGGPPCYPSPGQQTTPSNPTGGGMTPGMSR